MTRYKSDWWHAEIPCGWSIAQEDGPATFIGSSGALQVSAYLKDTTVTHDDLRGFAKETYGQAVELSGMAVGPFSGLHGAWIEDAVHWMAWLLRAGNLMLFVTYNGDEEPSKDEVLGIDAIVGSLRPG
jgi:hypothetical protein